MKSIKFLSYTFGLSLILSACTNIDTSVSIEKNVGYFVGNSHKSIDYSCENKRLTMTAGGKFECASFPISFYMNNTKIGEISSIHSDGYVYPQDIIVLEARVPVYTSENSISYLTIE